MSEETIEYLNNNTLIGFTDSDGNAWHWDGISQNQYPGAVPLADVKGHLFNWLAEYRPILIGADDPSLGVNEIDSHKALVRISTDEDGFETVGKVFGFVTDVHAIHQYDEWLIDNVGVILDEAAGDLLIGSAGLLRDGAQAWVQIRRGDGGLLDVGGDLFLPYLLAATSHDGSIATTYKWCMQRVVCDNTLSIGMGEATPTYKVKHTINNRLEIAKAREVLEVFNASVGDFEAEVDKLMHTAFTVDQVRTTIKQVYSDRPEAVIDDQGNTANIRAINNWDRRFDEIVALLDDPRVGEFKGTMWGATMAHNTWVQWGVAERDSNDRDTADVKLAQLSSTIDNTFEGRDDEWVRTMQLVAS